ncbi:RND transporter [endosymbiont of Lamellibrachia barhami]|uniref:RND transporter n=2 Tax=endosymbiont of Lamellibrachia barhami TaxID=205975 RepID=UPI00272983F2|nr:RND transporter [endosymbiont of Lamellibrachia barhami]
MQIDTVNFAENVYEREPSMMSWLDKIPLQMIVLPAVLLALAPFYPEPHLWEKLKMLADGTLSRPIDIFDLLMHGTPMLILVLKLIRGTKGADTAG